MTFNNNQANTLPNDLLIAKTAVYDNLPLCFTLPIAEKESAEYEAFTFLLNNLSVVFRVAKITPTKTGQFVTLWKRSAQGPIVPLALSDKLDRVIISTRSGDRLGQFIFPKTVLLAKGIISDHNKEGKRGFRVYPPWDKALNPQAKKSQQWQLDYFLEISTNQAPDLLRARQLLAL